MQNGDHDVTAALRLVKASVPVRIRLVPPIFRFAENSSLFVRSTKRAPVRLLSVGSLLRAEDGGLSELRVAVQIRPPASAGVV